MLGPALWAAAAFFIVYYFVGWKGWFVVGPLLVLLWINPAWGAALFLVIAAVVVGGLVLWLVWKILPWALFFILGIWMAYMIVVGLGMLMGV